MKIILEPLKIGAADLLRGVEYSHCRELFVYEEKRSIGAWKQRYVILSEGCLYIYKNKNSKTTKDAYSLQHFEYVWESEPESEEKICFCLHYRNRKPQKIFACDTPETREEWIKKLRVEMSHVQKKTHNLSADSGYGSAEAIPAFKESGTYELDKEGKKYDTVNERRLFRKQDQKGIDTHGKVIHEQDVEENDYEPINYSAVPNECKRIKEIEPENQGASDGIRAIEGKLQIKSKPNIFMEELKSKFNTENKGLSSIVGKEPKTPANVLRRDSAISYASSIVSVQGGDETSDNLINSQSFIQTQVVGKEPKTPANVLRRDSEISNASSFVSVQGGDDTSDNLINSQSFIQTQGHGKKIPIETKPTTLMAELSQKLKSDHKGLASGEGAISHTPLRRDSKISVASSFLSIHGGHETSDDLKSVSSMSEQLHESDK